MEPVADQGVGVRARDDIHRAAVTAVAAARAAPWHVLLAPEGETSTPSVSGRDMDVNFVYKHTIGDLASW